MRRQRGVVGLELYVSNEVEPGRSPSPGEPEKLISVRLAVITTFSVVMACGVGALTFAAERNLAKAVLAGVVTFAGIFYGLNQIMS